MKQNERFFSKFITAITVFASLLLICDFADAATRSNTRTAPSARKNMTTQRITTVTTTTETTKEDTVTETPVESVAEPVVEEIEQPELIISNKSNLFENAIYDIMESSAPDNSFAEEIRRQRAALEASESKTTTIGSQQRALATNSHACDVGLRKCMAEICGKDFTKCATDGATEFGDKLNNCRRNTECSGEEFTLFNTEIKADRDANVKLASYNTVLECGNSYNACIINECGTTYNKCLGKTAENSAIQKCSTIANECRGADSGLASRFGTAIGKLRENAEIDIKNDESRLYTLRDLMANSCKSLGAAFDERSFDCVYTVNFYAGENQGTPLASRKAYAGDSFVCMQEWFGTDTTTYRENAYRETRAQTGASSAMLGSGLGTAAGAISSGAIDRAIDTTKAKNALKNETNDDDELYETNDDDSSQQTAKPEKEEKSKKGKICTGQIEHALLATYVDDAGTQCRVKSCLIGYTRANNDTACIKKETTARGNSKKNNEASKLDPQTEQLKAGMQAAVSGENVYKAMQQEKQQQDKQITDSIKFYNDYLKQGL